MTVRCSHRRRSRNSPAATIAKSDLPRIRFHDLRQTPASLLVAAGAPIKVVAVRLGHSHPGFDPDGDWEVRQGLEGAVFDWGTYTFEDGVITQFNADDSYCAGAVLVAEVAFSENGDEMRSTFVSDTCKNTTRSQSAVFVKHSP